MEAKVVDALKQRVNLLRGIFAGRGEHSTTKTISVLSCVAALLGGYFQYLMAYQEQVELQAKADVAAATAEFVEISNAYAEAQTLQQRIYADYLDATSDTSDQATRKMATDAGHATFQHYIKAKVELQQNSDVFARKAQIYIDWPSNSGHNAANTKAMDGDPLTESLLASYKFDCNVDANLPRHVLAGLANGADARSRANASASNEDACTAANAQKETVVGSSTLICAINDEGKVNHGKHSIAINWQSARHHLLVMHYCFGVVHDQIATPRIWASDNDVNERRKADFLANAAAYQTSLDDQAMRLDAFMNLVMSQLDGIQVKYRPRAPLCHVPVLREAIGLFSSKCTPLRTA